jgi:uncharacterized protein
MFELVLLVEIFEKLKFDFIVRGKYINSCFFARDRVYYSTRYKLGRHTMPEIIGRKEEKALLERAYKSAKPEFITLYGRRRVGKTFLIRTLYQEKKDCVFFYVSGIKDGTIEQQVTAFADSLAQAFNVPRGALAEKKSWREMFNILSTFIKNSPQKKVVLFFDEFPWMVTRKSQLLQMLDYYWNRFWSMDERIKLIICGSASNWIINNIVNNVGGLYNRTTREMHLRPFNLYETKEYLTHKGVKLSNKEMVDLYMVLGGIPYYLDQVEPGYSAMQIIEQLAFKKGSFLLAEFAKLFDTLFGEESLHRELVRIIALHCYGIGQAELIEQLKAYKSGGNISSALKDLEQADFIQKFIPFGQEKKGIFYKLIDEYTLFYFQWIDSNRKFIERGEEKGYWMKVQHSPSWHSWAGCAFEAVCNKHVPLIREALHLTMARASQWRYVPKKGSKESGAQIDLLFDREDASITLCEIKYTKEPFVINKAYAQAIITKREVFREHTKTTKNLYFALISANGLKPTMYSEELVSGVVTLDDLFKEYVW